MKNDIYMNGRLSKYLCVAREHKKLEQRPTGLTKMKGTRDEPGQQLINRLTHSNYKHVKFSITRNADNFYMA